MKKLWKKEFTPANVEPPKKILNAQGEYLSEITNGAIIAKASEYDGRIYSGKTAGLNTIMSTATLSKAFSDGTFNVQNMLGDIKENTFKYEFYITSTKSPNYKYRLMFVEHTVSLYPVTIVLDEAISSEIKQEEIIVCNSMEDFEQILSMILNSNKIEKVISALLSLEL